jgi:hypothetical protein
LLFALRCRRRERKRRREKYSSQEKRKTSAEKMSRVALRLIGIGDAVVVNAGRSTTASHLSANTTSIMSATIDIL